MSLRGFSLYLSCGLLINCGHIWSSFPYLLSWSQSKFLSSTVDWFWGIFFSSFYFLSISFKLLSFIFFSPHFFSSKSPLGHHISCLMIYLGSMILISFILYQELYLLFDLIKVINFLFLLYLILISILRGQ